MADLPANVGTGIVRISLRKVVLDKSVSPAVPEVLPAVGKVRFTPSTPTLINVVNGLLIPTTPVSVHLDGNGDAVVTLVATDDTDNNPVDWTYTVSFELDSGSIDSFSLSVAEGSDVELSDVTPVPDSGGTYYLVGPEGPEGPTGPAGGVTDHGALTGLGDDDHTQYHNDTRGDARYYTQSQVDSAIAAVDTGAATPDFTSNTAGRWHGPMGPAVNYGQLGSTVTFHPMIFPKDLTITDIGFYVATAGDASAIVRVGLATRTVGSESFSVGVDWGQVTATSTGDKTISGLSTAVTGNTQYYWVLGMAGQSATTPILRGTADYGMGGYQFLGSATNTVGTNNMMGWRAAYAGGAFSASITPNATAYFQYPNIFFQI